MKEYLVSYTLFSHQRSLSGKDAKSTNSLDLAFEIFDMLNVGDDLYVRITPPNDRLIISVEDSAVYVELDYSIGGYWGKTMPRNQARDVLKNYQKYFDNPGEYGFEITEFS